MAQLVDEYVENSVERSEDECDNILVVRDLQCIEMLSKENTDQTSIDSFANSIHFFKASHRWFASRTVRGISFNVKRGERFVIYGDKRGSTALLEHILCLSKPIAGEVYING